MKELENYLIPYSDYGNQVSNLHTCKSWEKLIASWE